MNKTTWIDKIMFFVVITYSLDFGENIMLVKECSNHQTIAFIPHAAAVAVAKSLQLCLTLCDPIDGSPPGSPSLGFSRQEHWSGLPFPFPMHESEK